MKYYIKMYQSFPRKYLGIVDLVTVLTIFVTFLDLFKLYFLTDVFREF